MDQAGAYIDQNKGTLGTVAFLVIIIVLLYVAYRYLYPASESDYTKFLSGEHDARKPIHVYKAVPPIYTGGDFTLSFWIYIDDWNYKAASSKFLFALSPDPISAPTNTSPLVGLLSPLQNSLIVRANTVTIGQAGGAPPAAPTTTPPISAAGPDITIESNLQAVLNQQSSMAMFQSTVDTPCDVKEVPVQRWVNVTIVSSGRVLDVYMDGKLSRSCVLDNVVNVPRGPMRLRLAEHGGFGGRYATVQMWGQQLTPDVIYSIYMMGPTPGRYDLFAGLSKLLSPVVTFISGEEKNLCNLPATATAESQALISRFTG